MGEGREVDGDMGGKGCSQNSQSSVCLQRGLRLGLEVELRLDRSLGPVVLEL